MQVAKKLILEQLSPIYPKQEIDSISRLIFEKVPGLSRIQVLLNPNETISAANLAQIKEIVYRLSQFEPIQYILGETEFYGSRFKVNPSVLIPRPETEELVDWVVNDYKHSAPVLLDIGTGSGCIPISIVRNLPGASAEGWDISPDALDIANGNARNNRVKVKLRCVDILKPVILDENVKYDVIVSNPPYVTTSEQTLMQRNVINFEPHIALFVPDDDPLIFYRKISDLAINHLKPGGHLYLEINEKYGAQTAELFASAGFIKIEVKKDINGRQRMIKCEKPQQNQIVNLPFL